MENNNNITFEIINTLAVLYKSEKGYTKEVNIISWNGAEPKLDIRAWKPDHNRCMKGLTLTEQEGRELMKALVNLYQEIDKNTKNEP